MSFAIYGEANDMKLAATMGGGALSGPNAPVSPDPFYGVPAEAQQSGFGGERTSSGVNEACRLRQAERYAACEDDVSDGLLSSEGK